MDNRLLEGKTLGPKVHRFGSETPWNDGNGEAADLWRHHYHHCLNTPSPSLPHEMPTLTRKYRPHLDQFHMFI